MVRSCVASRLYRGAVKRFSWGALVIAVFVCLCCLFSPRVAWGETTEVATMYRLYNASSGEHLYTLSTNEYETLGRIGWVKEGPAWAAPMSSGTPVYRLYNPNSGDHHYTQSTNEYETLGRFGWVKEGVAWYSDDARGVAIYRLFNPNVNVGTHHYTQSTNEYETLGRFGWVKEGVAWYGVAADSGASNDDSFHGLTSRTPIMGSSTATAGQMVQYFESTGADYPVDVYTKYGAKTIEEFCSLLVKAANTEGVNAEVLFAQVMLETGSLQFGGQVQPNQCNFGGLGATDGGASGADFSSYGSDAVYTGLLAQAQHLKAYASTEPLKEKCVDPRFSLVARGKAPYVENLGGGNWASDQNYASKILGIMSRI